ncbi:MAG: DUF456 domain-containing protein [Elusimicrobiota bacterium]
MKIPRLALLALWALSAPCFAAAPVSQSGEDWKSVTFIDEHNNPQRYWFRVGTQVDHIPLYILKRETTAKVQGIPYFVPTTSAYELKITAKPNTSTVYSVTRPDTKLDLKGSLGDSLGAMIGKDKNASKTVLVIVDNPTNEKKTPISTAMGNLKQDASRTTRDYYFERAVDPNKPDHDIQYGYEKKHFTMMHRRVIPFELMLDPNNCFVRPEDCLDAKNKDHARFITAGEEAGRGNSIPTGELALENHRNYKTKALALKRKMANASETSFTEMEIAVLRRLLSEVGEIYIAYFYQEHDTARANPDTLKLFVKKWRTYLDGELDIYIEASSRAGNKEVNFAAMRKDLTERAQKNITQTLSTGGTAVYEQKPKPLLLKSDMEYLTPSETRIYESTLASAPNPKGQERNVQNLLTSLRAKIAARKKDGPYVALTEATFAAAPDWQKDKFCGSPVSPNIMTTANTQKNEAAINESGDAVKILGKYAKDLVGFNLTTAENVPNVGLPVSAFNLCREGYPFTQKDPPSGNKERQGPPPLDSENSNKAGNVSNIGGNSGSDNKNIAKKQENKDKDSEWLSRDLLGSAAKGAMVGLLVGSLFGPVGLIAGPIIGAAGFYGLTKLTSEKKPPE